MKTRTRAKKQVHDAPSLPPPTPPPLTPKPEHAGTPLRPDKFPSVGEVSTLAALLSKAPPQTDSEAQEAARAALRLWRVTRDEINDQRAYAETYWQSTDENRQGLQTALARIESRLELLGASHLGAQSRVTWREAADTLFPSLDSRARDAALSRLVRAAMVGKSSWSQWKLADFKSYGFDAALGFPSLVATYDEIETEKERAAKSQKYSKMGKRSAEKKKWGGLA